MVGVRGPAPGTPNHASRSWRDGAATLIAGAAVIAVVDRLAPAADDPSCQMLLSPRLASLSAIASGGCRHDPDQTLEVQGGRVDELSFLVDDRVEVGALDDSSIHDDVTG